MDQQFIEIGSQHWDWLQMTQENFVSDRSVPNLDGADGGCTTI